MWPARRPARASCRLPREARLAPSRLRLLMIICACKPRARSITHSNLDPNTSNQQRYLAVIQRMKDSSSGFYAKVSPVITVNGTTYASAAAYNASMFGSAGDIVVIQVKCTWPLSTPIMRAFFSNGKYTFTVGATMRNEKIGRASCRERV